jgi:hypothetical protein
MRNVVCLMVAVFALTGCPKSGGGGGGAAGMGGGAGAGANGPALHAAAAAVLTAASPCGFSSCHMGTGKAKLVLTGVTDLHAALVGKPSCEASNIPLVDGSGGEKALQNSWLWLKLTAPADPASGALTMQATWPAQAGACGQTIGPFGTRMPQSGNADMLDTMRLPAIHDWIVAGAPGPQ